MNICLENNLEYENIFRHVTCTVILFRAETISIKFQFELNLGFLGLRVNTAATLSENSDRPGQGISGQATSDR